MVIRSLRLDKETVKRLNDYLIRHEYKSLEQFLIQIIHGSRKLKGSKSPSNFREFKCEHKHYPYSCQCNGDHCGHVSCWMRARYLNGDALIGYLDIECSNLHADFGFVISWVLKERDKKQLRYDIINNQDIERAKKIGKVCIDERVVRNLVNMLNNRKYDYIICHYGAIPKGLDIRFLRTRALKYKLQFPVNRQMFTLDTYPIAKNKLKLHSNRLGSIAEFLEIPTKKTEVSPDMWIMGQYGDKKALDYILDHNKHDVEILEQVHKRLEAYGNVSKSSI